MKILTLTCNQCGAPLEVPGKWRWSTGGPPSTQTARSNSLAPRRRFAAIGGMAPLSIPLGRPARCGCSGYKSWTACWASQESAAAPRRSNSAAKSRRTTASTARSARPDC